MLSNLSCNIWAVFFMIHSVIKMEEEGLNEWQLIFNRHDYNGNGKITISDVLQIGHANRHKVPLRNIKNIFEESLIDENREVTYEEFQQLIKYPLHYKVQDKIIKWGNHYVSLFVPRRNQLVRDTGEYEAECQCWPPPLFIVLISLVEIATYLTDTNLGHESTAVTGPVANALLYDPNKREEFWRYATYMFVHIGLSHLIVNIVIQILTGLPLELVHRGHRLAAVYFAGVIAGSLATSVADPWIKLAGASGGVYSLLTAHLATIIMNWSEMTFPSIQLIIMLIVIGSDFGTAIYKRYTMSLDEQVGYAAHVGGAIAGLLVGIIVLRNITIQRHEIIIRRTAIVLSIVLLLAAIFWNIFFMSR